MAEVVAGFLTSAVVKIVKDKLSSAIAEQTGLFWNFSDDLEDMKDTMESMAAVLQDAEKQSIKKESVRLWLKRLKNAALDISDMMNDYHDTDAQPTAKMSGMFSYLIAARKTMVLANKMKNMREKLKRISKECKSFTFAENTISPETQQNYDPRETTSDVNETEVLGRDEEKKKITDRLSAKQRKDGTAIIPIYGLGGMGKSTLAQLIYNDTQFKQYEHRVWVYISEMFDLKKIGTSIISQLLKDRGQQNLDTLQMVQQHLDKLLPDKKILIVLDDIWQNDVSELDKLKRMLHVEKKCSIVDVIVTTRNEFIAKNICTDEPHKLQPLDDDVCWDIIKRYSGFKDKSNKGELELIGLEIAKKCGGVALASQAVGYTLRSKDLYGWSEMNNNDIWKESSGGDDSQHMKVVASLMISYERMLPILRLCFSYCAIFPKGHDIFEDDLVHQWVALDFIKKPSQGKEYIKQLLGMSFLQHSKLHSDYKGLRYTMHDLVHDLATLAIGDELTVIDVMKKSNHTSRQKYCRLAMLTNYDGQTKLSNILLKKVRIFHFSSRSKLLGPCDDSFSFAKCLRVLDFSGCLGITLPSSVGQLNQLRCLIAPEAQNKMLPESIAQLSKLQYLNLEGSSQMSALPESIDKLTGLIYLGLSHCCGILNIPTESFGGMKSLTDLNMSGCSGITVLPESVGGLKSLTRLYMSRCSGITVLPESVGGLESLTHLDMSGCSRITVLPESVGGLKSLTDLNMSWCYGITVLPESVGGLKSLTRLYMPQCSGITVLPESVGGLKSLTHLYMSECSGITVLSESVGGLESLTCLDMSGCSEITVLPESIGGLKSLTRLHMSWCFRITVLPKSFGEMESLTDLNMSGCSGITILPESVGELKSLTRLYMSGCSGITVFPESVGRLKSLTRLDMSNCSGITVLPESVGALKSLTHLYISECFGINVLPESVGGLESLTHLDMSGCSGITVLPESVGGLKSLTHLNMSGCSGITILPESVGALKSLTHLNMSKCSGITVLPESIGGLKSLTDFDMSWCSGITVLPESIGGLKSLTRLYMSGCSGITVLPKSVGGLKSLTHLSMSECSGITVFPESLGELTKLETLRIFGNLELKWWCELEENKKKLVHINKIYFENW